MNQPDNIELRSENIQELLHAVPTWMIRYGNLLILTFILMFLSLSWFIKYPDIIDADALVTTKLAPQKKYALIGGKLDSIFIQDNSIIREGSIIALIENTANYEHIQFLKSIVDSTSLNNTSFSFPLDRMPVLFLGEIDAPYAIFENNYLQYQLNKQLQPFANEAQGNQNSNIQLQSRLQTLRAQKEIQDAELSYQKKDLERQQQLFAEGVISKQALETAELSYLQSRRSYANMNASIAQLKEAIGNAKTHARNTAINKTREEISLLKNVIQSFTQLKKAIKEWEMKYTIRSDINGKVVYSRDWGKHQTISQGEFLFTIIPSENSAYLAKLASPPRNSGKLKVGQTVNIKLENYPESEFGTLKGQIEHISLLADEKGFYKVTVSLPRKLITSYKKTIAFRHEMRGHAKIITEDLRLMERFFYKLNGIFKR
ncbi:MAG: HlyD family efflux transporter periplasmic adaptor subunit [Bacteroidota bacterium]